MHITKWGRYGVLFTLYIAKRQEQGANVVGAADIAQENCIALDYAQQILQRLRRGSIIVSVRGSRGGYSLARPMEQISLLDVLVASEGVVLQLPCEEPHGFHIPGRCDGGFCALKSILVKLRDHINGFLEGYSIKQLCSLEASAVANLVCVGAMPCPSSTLP